MEEIKEGDIVFLKGSDNSPKMVVAFVNRTGFDGQSIPQKEWEYGCRWFDTKQEPKTQKFYAHELEKY